MQSEIPVYAWRPFDVAQDRLGAINLLKVVLLNISKVRIYAFSETVLRKNGPFGAVESSREAVVL